MAITASENIINLYFILFLCPSIYLIYNNNIIYNLYVKKTTERINNIFIDKDKNFWQGWGLSVDVNTSHIHTEPSLSAKLV